MGREGVPGHSYDRWCPKPLVPTSGLEKPSLLPPLQAAERSQENHLAELRQAGVSYSRSEARVQSFLIPGGIQASKLC